MLRRSAKNLKECLALIGEHAASESPQECCGIVLGHGPFKAGDTGPLVVFLCTNIQDIMHEREPETYKRDSASAYLIDPAEQAEVFRVAREEALDIIAFYHSHVDHGVYFSDEDKALATWDGAPTYPDAAYIIVSVNVGHTGHTGNASNAGNAGRAAEAGAFIWDNAQQEFKAISLT